MILHHGTTLKRAKLIMTKGPDIRYMEPHAVTPASNFCCNVMDGRNTLRSSEEYASGKAIHFPGEGGAAVLEIDVPDAIVEQAYASWLPLDDGVVQFDTGCGLEELLRVWDTIPKRIIQVGSP
jgi:hypothetical protein